MRPGNAGGAGPDFWHAFEEGNVPVIGDERLQLLQDPEPAEKALREGEGEACVPLLPDLRQDLSRRHPVPRLTASPRLLALRASTGCTFATHIERDRRVWRRGSQARATDFRRGAPAGAIRVTRADGLVSVGEASARSAIASHSRPGRPHRHSRSCWSPSSGRLRGHRVGYRPRRPDALAQSRKCTGISLRATPMSLRRPTQDIRSTSSSLSARREVRSNRPASHHDVAQGARRGAPCDGIRRMSRHGQQARHATRSCRQPAARQHLINRHPEALQAERPRMRSAAHVVAYADDLVILVAVCRRGAHVDARGHGKARLTLNEAKTSVRDARKERFDFFGYSFGPLVQEEREVVPGREPVQEECAALQDQGRDQLMPANVKPGGRCTRRAEQHAARPVRITSRYARLRPARTATSSRKRSASRVRAT